MVNTQLLESLISASGKTKSHLSSKLGISIQTFHKKCCNEADFKVSEMLKLCNELGVYVGEELGKIFLP